VRITLIKLRDESRLWEILRPAQDDNLVPNGEDSAERDTSKKMVTRVD
jgi:hypothetical protein